MSTITPDDPNLSDVLAQVTEIRSMAREEIAKQREAAPEPTREELLDALQVVREAIDIPRVARVRDESVAARQYHTAVASPSPPSASVIGVPYATPVSARHR